MFERKREKGEYEYTPDWDIAGYEDEEKFPKEKRKTKAEILAEIESEKQQQSEHSAKSYEEADYEKFRNPDSEGYDESEQSQNFPHQSSILSNPYGRVMEQADRFDQLSRQKDEEGNEPETKRGFSLFGHKKGKKDKQKSSQVSNQKSYLNETEHNFDEEYSSPYENGYEEIDFDEPHFHIPGIVWGILGVIVLAIGLVFIGYWNTDFSSSGQTYLVPLEVRYERQYVQKTDELLNYLLNMDKTLSTDLTALDSNYVSASNRLSQQKEELAGLTNSLSRYTGIPTKFENYQKLLLNHSISLQNFIDSAMERSQKSGYQEYLLNALVDYEESFEDVKQGRLEIEDEIFRNMNDSAELDSQESRQEDETNAQ